MRGLIYCYISLLFILFCRTIAGQGIDSTGILLSAPQLFADTSTLSPVINSENNHLKNRERSDIFYDSLEQKAAKNRWSKELHKLIVRNTQSTDNANIITNSRVDDFSVYENKVIRKIIIKQIDVFGPSIDDTIQKADNWAEKAGNSMHVQTNKRFIENSLFISEGELLDPYILADNERILRNLSSIQDVRIYILSTKESADSVDIVILTKDVMAFGFSWEAYDVVYGQASIWNSNLLGLGHHLDYTAYYNLNREPKYGYSINYRIRNISNSFASLNLKHTNRADLMVSEAILNRDFITPAIKFGGGMGYSKVKNRFTLETLDSTYSNIATNYEYYDLWGGYSIPIKEIRQLKVRKNYFFTGRAQIYNYFERPGVTENMLYQFYSRKLYLSSIGVTWQGYHTTRLIYGFGDTEDLPYGAMVKFTGGYEKNEFHYRQYYGGTISHSICTNKTGYFSNTLELGGFYRDKIEQGAIKYNFLHITPLLGKHRHKFRNFLTANYTQGINRFDDEFTLIEDEFGIRGFNNKLLKGTKRAYVNNELVYYSPHYIYGFRFVYFVFADMGIINHNNSFLLENPVYISTGLGVRIRNERLIFNTIQLQFNFFPLSPGIKEANKQNFDFISYPQFRMPEFAKRKPEVIKY